MTSGAILTLYAGPRPMARDLLPGVIRWVFSFPFAAAALPKRPCALGKPVRVELPGDSGELGVHVRDQSSRRGQLEEDG